MARSQNLTLENVKIMFRNFSGKPNEFNAAGSRNFCVELDPETAEELKADGWNVKYTHPRDEGDIATPYIQVTVKYGDYPPKIYLVTSRNKTLLDEDTVGELDRVEIEHVDLIINPYRWTIRDKSGVKAYCKTMYVTIEEDFGGRYSYAEEEVPFEV